MHMAFGIGRVIAGVEHHVRHRQPEAQKIVRDDSSEWIRGRRGIVE
jgi:hypothetical protein